MDFSHNEYVKDITSTIAFTAEQQDIIPTNTALFPLLSQFANNFELYKFNGLTFFYRSKTSSASNSSISSLGTVMYTIKYDPTLPPFTSKNEMQNYQGAQSCRPDNNLTIRCYLRNQWLYNRPGGLSRPTIQVPGVTAADKRNEVLGTLTIATQGQGADAVPIGELWVQYDVSFAKAKLYQTMGGGNRGAKYLSTSNNPNGAGNVLARFASTPTGTSMFWDEMNVQFPSGTTFTFDSIDGAMIQVCWVYLPLNTGSVGTTLTWTLSGTGGASPAFQLNDIATSVASLTQPRSSADAEITSATTATWSGTDFTTTSPNPFVVFRRSLTIKCRGSGRIQLSSGSATVGFGYNQLYLYIDVLDRPNYFPQNLTQSVLNPTWFTP